MSVTLVLSEHISEKLFEAVEADIETAGVLLARHVKTPSGNDRLLAREMHWVPHEAYISRDATELVIESRGYIPALSVAESEQAVPIWVHTHPGKGASPYPSTRDEAVDKELADLFRLRSGSPLYGALIVARTERHLCFSGHIDTPDRRDDIDRMWLIGDKFLLKQSWNNSAPPLPDLFDRNIRAFGDEVQRVLGDLRVAVVGCGGTGSAVIEQLVRLGVRHLHLLDPDILTESNLTRVYGSFPEDIGKPKVKVMAAHVGRIAPDAKVLTTQSKITLEATARLLTDADVVFGCTDDNAGRLILSRVASYMLTPVIDCGVVLSSDDEGHITGIDGRVTVLVPGTGCLVCRNRVDLQRAAAEMMSPSERQRRADEGYAPALEGVEPAVLTFTTQAAAAAVSELLERLIRYGPEPVPSEILLRAHEREISTNVQAPRERHYCHPDSGKLGLGITEPFLEQTWQV